MRTNKVSEEVLYPDEPVVVVDRRDIVDWVRLSKNNTRRRIRLCAHPSPETAVHEMLIVHEFNTYVRPHKHIGKSESFHVIEGDADILLLDESGKVEQVISMGPYASGRAFYYRLEDARYHTLLIKSDVFIFHETTVGPFRREQTVFAPWAPEESDVEGVSAYVRTLVKSAPALPWSSTETPPVPLTIPGTASNNCLPSS